MINLVNDYVAAVQSGYEPADFKEREICGSISYIIDQLAMTGDEEHIKCIGCKYMRYMWNQRRLDENDTDNDTEEQKVCHESDECVSFYHMLTAQAKGEYDTVVLLADEMEQNYDWKKI